MLDDAEDATMGTEAPETTPEQLPLRLRLNGKLVYDDMIVGWLDTSAMLDDGTNARLVLNLGWMKAAGLRIGVQGDPDVERPRSGYVLER